MSSSPVTLIKHTSSSDSSKDSDSVNVSIGDERGAAASVQGKRKSQEDAVCACTVISKGNALMFGVFDGHGGLAGAKAANLAAENYRTLSTRFGTPTHRNTTRRE